ncbi:MAG: SulP family inorganic anion transporter, partial [Gemmatales bacterium]|nr:SulP family inorganic anion transporter [Gemmatales bacterium]
MTKPDAPVTKGNWLLSDLLASIVLFLVAIPLSLGMAIAAGVPEHLQAGVGILAAVVGGIVVGLLGGSPLAVSGPEAGLAVMIGQFIEQFSWDKLCLIILTAGVLQLIAGILRLGQWFRAVPPAVIKALLAGMGLLIFASQFHIMVDEPPPGRGKDYGALINLISI